MCHDWKCGFVSLELNDGLYTSCFVRLKTLKSVAGYHW
jgi:hypothetical protein